MLQEAEIRSCRTKWEFPGRQLESISDRETKIEYSSTLGSGNEGAASGLVRMERKADDGRDRGGT